MRRAGNLILFAIYSLLLFAVGAIVGWGYGGVFSSISAGTPSDFTSEFRPFWEVWNLVDNEYFEQPIDYTAMVDGAINGMLETLGDPNTRYLDPFAQQLELDDEDGEFEGIGARIDFEEGRGVTIVSPIVGSPAEAAGLQPGDAILQADGVDLPDTETAIRLIRGEAGTPVVLTVERDGETFELEVVRGVITTPTVVARMLDENVAYIQLTQFRPDAAKEFEDELKMLLDQSPQGVVVDLRNNPGGLLNEVIDITDLFLDEGVILLEEFGNGSETSHRSDNGDIAEEIPLVVLINEGSASASEVFAGAIEGRDRGELVGVQSFGKGTVQTVRNLSNGGGVRVTIAHWLTPDGEWIHEAGVTPDVVVERGEINSDADPQLDAAVDLLLEQTSASK